MEISLNVSQTLGLSVVVLLLGILLRNNIKVLKEFSIPAAVIGGVIFSVINLIGNATQSYSFTFDTMLSKVFMDCFFASVGFGADMKTLKSGGKSVIVFLFTCTILVFIQNGLGAGIASLMGESPLFGLAAGSMALVGGPGTSAAYGPELIKAGLENGTTYALAAATFGLVSGSLIGGPVARGLIKKNNLKATGRDANLSTESLEESNVINSDYLLQAFFQISIAVGLGSIVSIFLNKLMAFPSYIGAMLIAVLMRNIFGEDSFAPTRMAEIDSLGEIFLSIFLAQTLMSLDLLALAGLALPLVTILLAQVTVMWIWAKYVIFNTMGKDYEAAVIAAGACGFGLGATSNAMANMDAVTQNYGPAPRAYFVVPIVGSLFIDIINAVLITIFIGLF